MRNPLRTLSRRKVRARRRHLRVESLDDRLAPAATSLYVITQEPTPGFFGTASTLKEFTPFGNHVRTVPVVPSAVLGEQAHDVVVTDDQRIHIYNGTTDAALYTYDGTRVSGQWSGRGQVGTSTDGIGSGGLARFGYDVFMTDMPVPGHELTQGIVWFNVESSGGPVMRFAEDHAPIDLAAGLDGKLYSLDAGRVVRVYDPNPNPPELPIFPQIGSVTLPTQVDVPNVGLVTMDYRAIAVDATGKIFAADWNGYLIRFTAAGLPETARRLPTTPGPQQQFFVENLVDIDFVPAPSPYDVSQLMVGSTNGVIVRADNSVLLARQLFDAGDGPAYLTLGPALVEVRITGPTSNVTEGHVGFTPVDFTISLSNTSAEPVAVNWFTVAGNGTAGVDYESGSGTVVFAPGETTKTVTINVIGDREDEFNESFDVRISAPAGAPPRAVYLNSQASAVIADDDPPATATPAAAVSAGNAWDTEPNGVFESFVSTTGTLQPYNTTDQEKRAVIEFDTNGIDLAASPVVTLDLYVEFPWHQSTGARIYGYAGNGQAALDDATQTSTLLGTLSNIAGSNVTTAWRRVTLDRAAVEGLMAQGQYLGIVIVADTNTFFDVWGIGSTHAPKINFWDSPPPILPIISVQGFQSTEGNPGGTAGAVLFNVTLSQPSLVPVTVNYATRDQPGVLAGVDYVAASGTLTFNPGEMSKDVWVEVIPDTTFEPNENFVFDLSNPTIASFRFLSALGRINNDDAQPTVGASSFAVQEGNSGSSVKDVLVTLSNPSYQTITVNYATANGTATAGSDYTAASGTLTFAPGEISKSVPITIAGDTTFELDEDFKFNITGATNATVAGTGSTTQTILNDDGVPTVSVSDWSGLEGGGGGFANRYTFRVSLSNASYQAITVNYAMVDGTATGGVDYGVFPPNTLTFPAGVTAFDFIGTLGADTMYELDETFTFNLSNPTNATLGAQPVGTGTILNDDPRPTVTVDSKSVVEGNSGTKTVTFTVRLSNTSYQPITVDYATANGTATAGSDYTAASGTLTFNPGQITRTVDVTVSGDTMFEADETFTLALSNPTNASLGTPATGTGTITNDDAAPTVSVNSPSIGEGDSGTTDLTFTVSLSNPSGSTIDVIYSTADLTARAGSDYTAASGTLTFAPGETSKPVTVSVTGDRTREPNETFQLNATFGSTTVSGTGTITNDDPIPTVSADAVTVDEGAFGQVTDAVFTVSLTNPSGEPIRVDYRPTEGTALADDLDYGVSIGTLTFAPGETSKTVAIPVFGDAKYELDESFTLTLSNPTGATLGANGVGNIRNDDAVPVVHIIDATVSEGNSGTTPTTFGVFLSNPSYLPITVDYATGNGTATAGSDYTATSGTLTFASGVTVNNVTVDVAGDNVYEGTEHFTVNLSNAVNATIGTPQASGTITDDDLPTVTAANASVTEVDAGSTSLVFTLSLSNPSVEPITVNYATADGTATAGSDYTATASSVTFAPGQTSQSIAIDVTGDHATEPDETLNLNLSLPAGTNAILGTSSVVGTILNDDFAPVADAGPDQSADEGTAVAFDGSGSFDPDGAPLTYSWNFGDGSPADTGVSPTHTYEDNETFTVTLTVSDGHGGVATDTAVVTVRNVAPTAAVSGPASGVRGQTRTFTLTASDPSSADRAAGFDYRIDWGDGTTGSATGAGAGTPATHIYTAAGNFTVRVWATDKDGAEGSAATRAYTSKVVEVQGNDLIVGGTTNGDTIAVAATTTTNAVTVTVNGAGQGTYTASGQIVVDAQAGNDQVTFPTIKSRGVTYNVRQALLVFGGDGTDTLDARKTTGPSAIVGGNGNDTLFAGDGRSILIGGAGADVLRGGAADDIVIGGSTSHDADPTGLAALRAEWGRTDAGYSTRRDRLLGVQGGGFNGTYLLTATGPSPTVHDDGGFVDTLFGNGGQDWFFAASTDQLRDRQSNETVTGL